MSLTPRWNRVRRLDPRRLVCRAALGVGLAATALLALPSPAQAFCRSTSCTGDCPRDFDGCKTTGEPLHWPTMCVGYSLQRDGSENIPLSVIRSTVARSFVAWSDLPCEDGEYATMAFAELDDVTCKQSEYNPNGPNTHVILFQDHRWQYSGVDNTLAKTTVTFNEETGEILDADIEINHAYNYYTVNDDIVEYDLQSVMTHEIGHFIGLDHTPDFAATMYATYERGSISPRFLGQDDVDAVCAAYPPDRGVRCEPTPRGGLGDRCGGDESQPGSAVDSGGCHLASPRVGGRSGSSLLAALFGVALVLRRRRAQAVSVRRVVRGRA